MKKNIVRNTRKGKARYILLQDKSIKKFWGNAARLEYSNVRNKNKGKKG